MAGWSQFSPEIVRIPCRFIAHPWTDNCLSAVAFTWVESFLGSAKFFTFLYLCQYVSAVLKKKKTAKIKNFLWMFIRSTVFAATVSATTFGTHCLLRRLIGKFYYYTLVFIPAFLGGFAIYMESKKARELYVNAFANCALELWIKVLEEARVLRWNRNIQTVVFMILSSFLSSLLSVTNFDSNYFWFFIPPKANKNENKESQRGCFHEKNCKKHIFNLFIMYATTGFVLQFIRLLIFNLKNPKLLVMSLKSPKTFKLAGFFGSYVVVYQAIRCFLYQKEKKFSFIHDSLAGFFAGLAFQFQPTVSVLNSALITLIQILTEISYQRKMIPDIPYLEILFSFFCGLLFHSRIILAKYYPQLMVYIMSTVTHGMAIEGKILFTLDAGTNAQNIERCSTKWFNKKDNGTALQHLIRLQEEDCNIVNVIRKIRKFFI